MSFWSNLVDKTRSTFAAKPKLVMNAVERGRLDEMTYRDLVNDIPALDQVAYDLNETHAFTGELVQDSFNLFFKGEPELTPVERMDARALINHAVIETVRDLPETAQSREITRHDIYGAALHTIGLESTLDQELTRSEKAKEVKENSEKAAAAEQAQRDAEQAAQDLADQLADAPETGPLTAEQQQLAEQLQQALDAAQQAGQEAADAREQTQQAVAQLQRQVRGKARQSVQESAQQLQDEKELFAAFGYEPGVVSRMSFSERQALVQMLANSKIGRWRKLIGRYRMRASAERAHKVQYGRDEVSDITFGKDLRDVFSSEFANLAHPVLRLQFLQRYSEGMLLSREWRGVEKVGDGAVIAMLDTSSSMRATDVGGISREAWGKAVTLSMIDQAHAAKRDCVIINFASAHQQRVWRFPAGEPIDTHALIEWGEHMFNGGTNYDRPIDLATDILEEEYNTAGKQRGDLVMLTDDECSVTPQWMKRFQERKKRLDFRMFGVSIGSEPGLALAALCDNVRGITEFADPGQLADIYRSI